MYFRENAFLFIIGIADISFPICGLSLLSVDFSCTEVVNFDKVHFVCVVFFFKTFFLTLRL